MFKLRLIFNKLEQARLRLASREKDLFRRVVEARKVGDSDRALRYANEVAVVRRWLQKINNASLELEAVMLRLETVQLIEEYAAPDDLRMIVNMLANMRNLSEIGQMLGVSVDEIVMKATEMLGVQPGLEAFDWEVLREDPSVQRVLEEAMTVAKFKTEAPATPVADKIPERKLRVAEAIAVGGTSTVREEDKVKVVDKITVSIEKPSSRIDEMVYQWAIDHQGVIDLKKCADHLGVSTKEVLDAINRLVKVGRFKSVQT